MVARAQIPADERLVVTLVLRRRALLPEAFIREPQTLSSSELTESYGADPDDADLVAKVLGRFGFDILETDLRSRRIRAEADAETIERAFGSTLFCHVPEDSGSSAEVSYRCREGELQLPAELADVVTAVLGVDNRPQARPSLQLASAATGLVAYTPPELARIYNFPEDVSGAGQRLAILELGGGYSISELQNYFAQLGVAAPTVRSVSVDGASNAPQGTPNGPDGEVLLDIEVAGAMANGAEVIVYFAPNTDQGFLDAVSKAIHASPAPTALSISWGAPEYEWTDQAVNAMNEVFADAAALGVTVIAAAGDDGSSNGGLFWESGVNFPASSQLVLACGGTTLYADPSSGAVSSETVWNAGSSGATGGGISDLFLRPTWQSTVSVPGGGRMRGLPDVSAVADSGTGYIVLVDGVLTVLGGTSAVAPLWAALVCRLVESLGRPLGLLQPLIYPESFGQSAAPAFRDITQGSNGAYQAAAGWDACTGLGVPNGEALLDHLRQQIQT
ncbi:Peptidase S53 propeptide [Segniliparus rotundus DSM 44985]|uniref:Peptidase S53 propeptide n=2 Tax=Segniliparus rotundus TaxID=286802 RepID=D6Z7D3_SEGRD|nr:Peptidase S53 propeptide [Segniliparus rotundus DSM 44985]